MKHKIHINKKAIIVWGLIFIAIGGWYLPETRYVIGLLQSKIFNGSRVAGSSIAKLDVPYHRQQYSLSCEIASLKMALNYAGVNVSEQELIDRLKFEPPLQKSGKVWGDPYEGFVGKIDGKMGRTGYGVYWDPIAEVGNFYRPTYAFTNMTPQDLTNHILNNRPVVVWGYFGRGNKLKWQTPEGEEIIGINGEHARVVTGFTGTHDNPEGFFILDPIYGELYWETEKLMKNGAPFENAGVVVY
jgi:uncharacterized protein YvpB